MLHGHFDNLGEYKPRCRPRPAPAAEDTSGGMSVAELERTIQAIFVTLLPFQEAREAVARKMDELRELYPLPGATPPPRWDF